MSRAPRRYSVASPRRSSAARAGSPGPAGSRARSGTRAARRVSTPSAIGTLPSSPAVRTIEDSTARASPSPGISDDEGAVDLRSCPPAAFAGAPARSSRQPKSSTASRMPSAASSRSAARRLRLDDRRRLGDLHADHARARRRSARGCSRTVSASRGAQLAGRDVERDAPGRSPSRAQRAACASTASG